MTVSLQPPSDPDLRVPSRALIPFVLMTFGITWGLVGVYVLAPGWASEVLGLISGSHPLFFLATWAPAIAAFTLVARHGGWRGVTRFLSRLALWRIPAGWVAFVLLGVPLVYMAGSLVKGGPLLAPVPPGGGGQVLAVLFMMLFLGPVEEFGWRGFAQPLLQRHVAPALAGLLIGVTWGLWHLPAFFLSGTVFATWNFLPFFVGNVTLALLATPILNAGRGGLVWPMLFHWQLINPVWPDAQPWDTWIFVAVALVVAWTCRATLFGRAGAVTEVIPPDAAPAP